MEAIVTVLAGAAIAVGVVGSIVPVLPGIALVWITMLVYGLVTGFGTAGWVAMALATLLAVGALVLGVLIPQRSAAGEGVSAVGQLLGLALAIVGFFAVPVVGAPLGFTAGIWLARLHSTGDARRAWQSTKRTVLAMVRVSLVELAAALGMAVAWAGWVVLG